MGFKSYFIKKGKHRSGFFPNLYLSMFGTKYSVIFSKDCIYKFGDVDDFDVNKLFGLSYGLHHENSIRFGWNIDGDKIAIYSYCYKNSERFISKIISISVETTYKFEIIIHDVFYELRILDQSGKLIGTSNVSKPKTLGWGYRLFPYFGGNKCAPHNMVLKMQKIY